MRPRVRHRNRRRRRVPRPARRGFVLIAALWLLVALGAVALDVSLRTKARRLAAAHVLDESRARAAAMGGAEYARARLGAAIVGRADEIRAEVAGNARFRGGEFRGPEQLRQRVVQAALRPGDPAEDPWREPQALVLPEHGFADARFSLHVRDTGAALNLNEASEQMLRQFFAQGLRLDYALADRLAQAILDWRDEDDSPRLNGAEREQYLRDGAPVLPPDRPFEELAELRWVRGMTDELYEAARPYLTLTSSGRVNLNAAPEPVLLALPGMTPAGASELLRLRAAGTLPRRERDLEELLSTGVLAGIQAVEQEFGRRVTYTTDEVEIIADGWVEGSPIRVRTRTVVARAQTGAVVVWRKLDR